MKKVEVVRLEQLYASPANLAKLYDLGMTHTRALINEMRASKKMAYQCCCVQPYGPGQHC